jgi:branched-chain amino acid transport system permease protein
MREMPISRETAVSLTLLIALLAAALIAQASGETFYVTLATSIAI